MNLLWFLVLFNVVLAETLFGSSYLKDSTLCKPWTCVSTKLGIQDSLPPREQFSAVLKSLLAEGEWQDIVPKVLDVCYSDDRPRRYTPTCPGQSLLHCVYDQLIENCPESKWVKEDACAPLSSLAGFKYMFSQSRYQNLEKYLPTERKPIWFLNNYFSSKCCNVPDLFNSIILEECGFSSIIRYYPQTPQLSFNQKPKTNYNQVEVDISLINETSKNTENNKEDSYKIVTTTENNTPLDPLDCCDVSELIEKSWRDECDFHLKWDNENRLTIGKENPFSIGNNNNTVMTTTEQPSTTTAGPRFDVKAVPLACEQEICVFDKLKVITPSGKVDTEAFLSLLNNMTNNHPEWNKAKARVITNCLSNPMFDYSHTCEINKVLECTFDVLSENCPTAKKQDPCKRKKYPEGDSLCQISSSKYRPKNRRLFCGLPNIVNHDVLSQCGLTSISRFEYIPEPVTAKPIKRYHWMPPSSLCKELTTSTKCVLNKMGVMSKYGFIDYFKMKDRLRNVVRQQPWHPFSDIYMTVFTGNTMYKNYCSSPRKLLSLLDVMIRTCPISKRNPSEQCNKLFKELPHTPLVSNKHKSPLPAERPHFVEDTIATKTPIPKSGKKITLPTALPPIEIMDITPQTINKRPHVILPVYLRSKGEGSLSVRPYKNSLLRSNHFMLPNEKFYDNLSNFDIRN